MTIDAFSVKNIFAVPQESLVSTEEIFETLFENQHVTIERIVSNGQSSPEGFWYDQIEDEWVILLTGQAQIEFENGRIVFLKSGDYLFLPAHSKHRVHSTSKEPNCIWLAIHTNMK